MPRVSSSIMPVLETVEARMYFVMAMFKTRAAGLGDGAGVGIRGGGGGVGMGVGFGSVAMQ